MKNEQAKSIKPISSIYIAGKMHSDDWRLALCDGWEQADKYSKYNPLTVCDIGHEDNSATVCGLRYTGPFFVSNLWGHGYDPKHGDPHGIGASEHDIAHGANLDEQKSFIFARCMEAILQADLIFAWIDCTDCYGTIAEIGYANALGKHIWIASPRPYHDLWFVYAMANRVGYALRYGSPAEIKQLLQSWLDEHRLRSQVFQSPIEQRFWQEWVEYGYFHLFPLVSQHAIGPYKVDFAHLATKTVIELDGFATHSSTDDIAKDRKRQRQIEALGWHVIRFGGKEIYSDADTCVKETADILAGRMQKGTSL